MGYNTLKDGAGNELTFGRVEEFFYFLSEGKLPEGMVCRNPRLGKRKAMAVIWFLQEHMNIIPTRFELCVTCGNLYDSSKEGEYAEKTGRCHCDNCRR